MREERRLEELVGRRDHGPRRWQVDLVQEAAEAARAEDVRGRVRDGAHRAAAHVAPVQAPRPPAPSHAARRARGHDWRAELGG